MNNQNNEIIYPLNLEFLLADYLYLHVVKGERIMIYLDKNGKLSHQFFSIQKPELSNNKILVFDYRFKDDSQFELFKKNLHYYLEIVKDYLK